MQYSYAESNDLHRPVWLPQIGHQPLLVVEYTSTLILGGGDRITLRTCAQCTVHSDDKIALCASTMNISGMMMIILIIILIHIFI